MTPTERKDAALKAWGAAPTKDNAQELLQASAEYLKSGVISGNTFPAIMSVLAMALDVEVGKA